MLALTPKLRSLWGVVASVVLMTCALLVYLPGLGGPFLFDDFPNIIEHPYIAIAQIGWKELYAAVATSESGPLGRPLPVVTFALNYYFAGQRFDSFAFQAVNVVIHACNGVLVWALSRRLVGCYQERAGTYRLRMLGELTPVAVAALWLLHPIQLTSVLYVVQRINSMAAFFVLFGLLAFVVGRQRLAGGRRYGLTLMLAGMVGGTGLGLLCKENAVLLPLFALIIEGTMFDRRELATGARWRLGLVYTLLVVLPGVIVLAWVVHSPGIVLGGYAFRPFDLQERTLTELRVLLFYLGLVVLPRVDALGLFHDDIVLSRSLFDPIMTLFALTCWIGLLAVSVWAFRRGWRLPAFAVGWFLAGHLLESTVIALDIAYEHRNYLPVLGPLLALSLAASRFADWVPERAGRRMALVVLPFVFLFGLMTHVRAGVWGDQERWATTTLLNHPDSYRTNLAFAQHAVQRGRLETAYAYYQRAGALAPDKPEALMAAVKVVNLLETVATAPGATGATPAISSADEPKSYAAPLVLDAQYLQALKDRLVVETSRRLASQRPGPGTLQALRRLRWCIQTGDRACALLTDVALDWMNTVLTRNDLRGPSRGVLLFNAARLYAQEGRHAEAVDYARRARLAHPADTQILIYEVSLHIEREDWEAAEDAISLLAAQRGPLSLPQQKLEWLRRQLPRSDPAGAGEAIDEPMPPL